MRSLGNNPTEEKSLLNEKGNGVSLSIYEKWHSCHSLDIQCGLRSQDKMKMPTTGCCAISEDGIHSTLEREQAESKSDWLRAGVGTGMGSEEVQLVRGPRMENKISSVLLIRFLLGAKL